MASRPTIFEVIPPDNDLVLRNGEPGGAITLKVGDDTCATLSESAFEPQTSIAMAPGTTLGDSSRRFGTTYSDVVRIGTCELTRTPDGVSVDAPVHVKSLGVGRQVDSLKVTDGRLHIPGTVTVPSIILRGPNAKRVSLRVDPTTERLVIGDLVPGSTVPLSQRFVDNRARSSVQNIDVRTDATSPDVTITIRGYGFGRDTLVILRNLDTFHEYQLHDITTIAIQDDIMVAKVTNWPTVIGGLTPPIALNQRLSIVVVCQGNTHEFEKHFMFSEDPYWTITTVPVTDVGDGETNKIVSIPRSFVSAPTSDVNSLKYRIIASTCPQQSSHTPVGTILENDDTDRPYFTVSHFSATATTLYTLVIKVFTEGFENDRYAIKSFPIRVTVTPPPTFAFDARTITSLANIDSANPTQNFDTNLVYANTLSDINGRTAINLTGGWITAATELYPVAPEMTLVAVVKPSSSVGQFGSFFTYHPGQTQTWGVRRYFGSPLHLARMDTTGWIGSYQAWAGNNTYVGTNYVPGAPTIYVERMALVSTSPYTVRWKLLMYTTSTGTQTVTNVHTRTVIVAGSYKLTLGGSRTWGTNNELCNSTIGQVKVYNRELTDAEVDAEVSSLKTSWGIA